MSSDDSMMPRATTSLSAPRRIALFDKAAALAMAAGLFLIVGIIGGAVIAGGWGEALRAAGIFLAVGLGLPAFIIYLVARKRRRETTALFAGSCLAHWVYSQEEWERYLAAERARVPRYALVIGLIMLLPGIAVTIGLAGGTNGLPLPTAIMGGMGGTALFGFILGMMMQAYDMHVIRLQERIGGEVFIGQAGLYHAGTYWAWKRWGVNLTDADHQKEPVSQICFTFLIEGKTPYSKQVYVPVPEGEDDQATLIVETVLKLNGLSYDEDDDEDDDDDGDDDDDDDDEGDK